MVAVTQLLHRNNRKAADAARPFTDDDLDPGDTFFSQSFGGPITAQFVVWIQNSKSQLGAPARIRAPR
jgi:hypothetical protein